MDSSPMSPELGAAVDAVASGRMVVFIDDVADRPTGALVSAAETTDADMVNEMCVHGRGLVCLALQNERADALGLGQQDDHAEVAYTVSIEAATGVTTGISAGDRARTIEVAIDPGTGPDDVVTPGHLFPVVVHRGGVLGRRSVAEASVDLARLAGCSHLAGVYCHVLSEDGAEASPAELRELATRLEIPVVTVSDLVRHRTIVESLVRRVEAGAIETAWGRFDVSVWENLVDGSDHLLLSLGSPTVPAGESAPLVRLHSQCLTGDAFRSQRCDCGHQLDAAMAAVSEAGCGAVLYLRQEGRGIGLVAKLQAYELQDRGRDTVEANVELGFKPDMRDYAVGAQILHAAGYRRLRLITNNPRKIQGLEQLGLVVEQRISAEVEAAPPSRRYLKAKREKLGHLLESV